MLLENLYSIVLMGSGVLLMCARKIREKYRKLDLPMIALSSHTRGSKKTIIDTQMN